MNAAVHDDAQPCDARSRGVSVGHRLTAFVTVGWQHVTDDPLKATVLGLRLVPSALKRPIGRAVLAAAPRRFGTVRALVLWDRGQRSAATSEIVTAAQAGRPSRRRRLGHLAVALDQPTLAHEIAQGLPTGDARRLRLEALAAANQGELQKAAAILRAADPDQTVAGSRALRRLRRRLDAELAVLDPERRPIWTTPRRGFEAVRGRILHLVTNSLPHVSAGYTVRTHMIARAQREAGLDPHIVTRLGFPVAQGVLRARECDLVDDVPYHRLLPRRGLPPLADQRFDLNAQLAAELLEQLRPAVLHAASNHVNGQLALALRQRYGLPYVYEVRGFLEESWLSRQDSETADTSDRYLLARDLETHCMRNADAVVTLSEGMKEQIAARGVPAERISVVPNAVDEGFLAPPPDPAPGRDALGARAGEPIVGILSTFYPHEGIDVLVRAVAMLRERGHQIRLVLVGDGIERQALERLVAEVDLRDVTTFTGRVPFTGVHKYYAAIDVFAVPRTDDQVNHMVTPLKPIEAMATGRPVVASKVGGLVEIIEDGVTGILVPPEDPAALADAIEPLLYDEALRARLGAAARESVAKDRTWSRNAERYRALYGSLGAL